MRKIVSIAALLVAMLSWPGMTPAVSFVVFDDDSGAAANSLLRVTQHPDPGQDASLSEDAEEQADIASGPAPVPIWELGRPSLPVHRFCMAVPRGAKLKLTTTLTAEQFLFLERELPPMQPLPSTCGKGTTTEPVRDKELYSSDDPYPAERARLVNRGFLRDLEVVTVEVAPLQYLPESRALVIAEGLKVVLECEGGGPFASRELEASQIPMYRAMLANFEAVETEARAMPSAAGPAPFAPDGADILIIAYDAFIPYLSPLVTWRESQGYLVEVVAISSIYGPDDDTDDERIAALRNYLIDIMTPVPGWNPRPTFVLLVGDKSEITPAYFTGTYGDLGWTDHHYSCVIGDDWYSDLAIGRFSASTSTDVINQVNKTLFYEQNPQAHTAVPGASGGIDGDFERCENAKKTYLLQAGGLLCKTNYNGSDGSNYNTYVHAFNGTVDPATGKNFAPGTGIITVDTHGSSSVWGGLLSSGSVNDATLTNRDYFPMAFITACNCGRFEVEDCIMEKLQQIQGGTVANSGSATLACGRNSDQLLNIAVQGLMGVNPPYHPDMFECMISPDIGHVPILGQAMAIAKNEYLAHFGNPDGWNVKECMMQYNLLGDPALMTNFEPPQITQESLESTAVSLEWTPIIPPDYTVEYRDSMEDAWQPVPGTAWPIEIDTWTGDDISGVQKRFYRVVPYGSQ